MSWVEPFLKKVTGKADNVGFPETGSILQDQKRATVFKEKERMVKDRLNIRYKQELSFKRYTPHALEKLAFLKDKLSDEEYKQMLETLDLSEDYTMEPSLAESIISQTVMHSAAFHGIGSRHPVTAENILGYFRLSRQLRSFQREYGSDDMLVQCLFQRLLTCDQSMGFRSFTEEDLGIGHVIIPLESPDLFKGLDAHLPDSEREKKS